MQRRKPCDGSLWECSIPQHAEYDLLVVGGGGVDTIVRVDSLPVPLADSVDVSPIEEWPGHTGGNVAFGVQALGLKVALLDCIGDDWIGAQVRERLARGDVEFAPLISRRGHPPGGEPRGRDRLADVLLRWPRPGRAADAARPLPSMAG